MDTQTQSQSHRSLPEPEVFEFEAHVGQITTFGNLVRSVAFTTKVNVTAMPRGLRFVVEEGKYVQASVTINRDIFDDYALSSDEGDSGVQFKVGFKELLDCLKFFCSESHHGGHGRVNSLFATTNESSSSASSLRLKYKSYGSPLQLLLDEGGIVTDFQIMTEPFDEDLMDFEVDSGPLTSKVIVTSEHMSDLLAEFESNNPASIQITIVPDREMRLSCDGVAGVMRATVPANSSMVQLFESMSELTVTYKFAMLRYSFRAMNLSQTMSLKIDVNGVLRLTYLMPSKTDSFVEFFCLPTSVGQEEIHAK